VCFSFSDHFKHWAAKENSPGINYLDTENFTDEDILRIKRTINEKVKLKSEKDSESHSRKEVDMIIVSIHWGPNYRWKPLPKFQELAHKLIDECGVGLIHGHSAHHPQGIEVYKGVPIIYGCGDFIDDYAVDDVYRNDLSFLYQLLWNPQDGKWKEMELFPVKISKFSTLLIKTRKDHSASLEQEMENEEEEKEFLFRNMEKLSADFGTRWEKRMKGDGEEIETLVTRIDQ